MNLFHFSILGYLYSLPVFFGPKPFSSHQTCRSFDRSNASSSVCLIVISVYLSQTEDNAWKQELQGSAPAVLILQTLIYGKSVPVPSVPFNGSVRCHSPDPSGVPECWPLRVVGEMSDGGRRRMAHLWEPSACRQLWRAAPP